MVFQTMRYFWNPSVSASENGENPMATNKSSLKDFLVSIAGMTGDLSNITAPPFVLDTKSVVEIPAFWAENPSVFVSPATSEDPAERALLVLKSFLAGIKSQCYMGHTEEEGVKKPLNAFLGEVFLGHWEDEQVGTTYLVSEQVSHHPPITACRVWNPKHGVVAQGYNRQKVTFSMSSLSVHIHSTGFALKSLEKYDEHYMVPLPDFKVKGVLSGAPYPETDGIWYIPSTSGYMSKIDFSSGHGWMGGGKRHQFSAVVYKEAVGPKEPLYSIEGCWNTEFTVRDELRGKDIETFSVSKAVDNLPPLQLPPLEEMDPWESRRAWHDTQEAIRRNDYRGVSAAKSYLEQGQRNMRKDEEKSGSTWQQLFFKSTNSHQVIEQLMTKIPGDDFAQLNESTKGVWVFDHEAYEKSSRPYHASIEPDNLKEGEERVYRNGSRASFQSSRTNTPRGSVDFGRSSIDLSRGRGSLDSPRAMARVNEKLGAENGQHAQTNGTQVDVERQSEKRGVQDVTKDEPAPQSTQPRSKDEELGSGVEGLSVKEKGAVEDMLRDTYASGGR